MEAEKPREVLLDIIEATLGSALGGNALLLDTLDAELRAELIRTIQNELSVKVTPDEVRFAASVGNLSALIQRRLPKDSDGRSVIDIYAALEEIARSELHRNINFRWYSRWADFLSAGNWLSAPDRLDYVELVMHIEEAFGFSIPNQDAEAMQTVKQTVQYVFDRCHARNFVVRQLSEDVCQSAFIFHELRRLMVVRGGVTRSMVRPNACLGDLMPSWYVEFWRQVENIFGVELPHGSLLAFGWRLERRTTVSELTHLVITARSSK